MKNLKKTFLVVLGLSLIVSMTFFGCSKKEASASVASASDTFDLSVCFASEPQTIDPALNSAVDGAVMLQHFFEGLMKWADGGNPATDKGNMNYAKLVNGQAASYEKTVNADGTVTYTFKIRPDAKWSDGKAVTADDFVFTWQRLATPETAADYCYMIDMVKGYAEVNSGAADPSTLAVSAPDASTFQVTITYDCPYFLEVCAFPATFPVRKDIVEANLDTWTTANNSANYKHVLFAHVLCERNGNNNLRRAAVNASNLRFNIQPTRLTPSKVNRYRSCKPIVNWHIPGFRRIYRKAEEYPLVSPTVRINALGNIRRLL